MNRVSSIHLYVMNRNVIKYVEFECVCMYIWSTKFDISWGHARIHTHKCYCVDVQWQLKCGDSECVCMSIQLWCVRVFVHFGLSDVSRLGIQNIRVQIQWYYGLICARVSHSLRICVRALYTTTRNAHLCIQHSMCGVCVCVSLSPIAYTKTRYIYTFGACTQNVLQKNLCSVYI